MTELQPLIRLDNTHIPSPFPAAPSFYFHLTHLTSTLFIWVGTGKPSTPGQAGILGLDEAAGPEEKRLAGDWAVAMPSYGVCRCSSPYSCTFTFAVRKRSLIVVS